MARRRGGAKWAIERVALLMVMVMVWAMVALKAANGSRVPNQDVCVADLNSDIYVDGFACRRTVRNADFASRVLRTPGTFFPTGFAVQQANVFTFPGSNTQGLSLARVDIVPRGLVAPHHHPRASQMIMIIEGPVIAAFITGDRQPDIDDIPIMEGIQPNRTLFYNTLQPYDAAIFPHALIHWVFNPSYNESAQYVALFNNQNQGAVPSFPSLFASNPPIPDSILAQSLGVSELEVRQLRRAGHYYDYPPHV